MASRLAPMTRDQYIHALILEQWKQEGEIIKQNAQSFAQKYIFTLGIEFKLNAKTVALNQITNAYVRASQNIFVQIVAEVFKTAFRGLSDMRIHAGYQIMRLIQQQHPQAKPDDEVELQTNDKLIIEHLNYYHRFNNCRVVAAAACQRQGLGNKMPELISQSVIATLSYKPAQVIHNKSDEKKW